MREKSNQKEGESLTKEMFEKLYRLEVLRDDWEVTLHKTQDTLFTEHKESYGTICSAFENYKKEHPEIDIHLEQILVYFLFTYFPGAVYDGMVFAKVQMAVFCTWMVELLWMGEWNMNGKVLEKQKMIKLLYRFSREVEHSDENLTKLDKMMEKKYLL